MGRFGPGTSKPLSIISSAWKVTGNAIENKNRPESLYITMSSWVKPSLNMVKAKAHSTSDPDELVKIISKEFESGIKYVSRNFGQYFDPKYFDTASIIFTYDYAPSLATVGKRQFLEIEINIDTVNDIDVKDNPAPNAGTGKINNIPFKDFIKPMENAVNKILSRPEFDPRKCGMSFSTKKGDK